VTMGGATMTAAPPAGTYGRFRVIPGTDQVALVNGVFENVFIGTVPFDGGTPPPPPPVDSTPPTASMTSPSSGATVSGTITVSANASDNVGVAGVQFKLDGSNLGSEDTSSPYSVSWNTSLSSNSSHTLTAIARDAAGNIGTSPSISVTVNNTAPPPPPSPGAATLTANPTTITSGQSSVLTLFLSTLDYHNIFINNVGPSCAQIGTTFSCTLTVSPTITTTYQAAATNSGGVPYTMPGVVVTLQSAPGSPPPPPSSETISVLPGLPLPLRKWVERPNPNQGRAFMAGGGGKHGRAFYHPGLKSMVFAGGDWASSMASGDGVGSEIWSLDVFNDRWTLQRPFEVAGETQPGRPDTVGWAYDSKRNRGLMNPGFYFSTQGATPLFGAIYGWGGYAFDFVTKKFTGPDAAAGFSPPTTGWGGDTGSSYSVANPTRDELVRTLGTLMQRYNLATKTWTTQQMSTGNPSWNPVSNRAQLVVDVAGQAVYWLDIWSPTRAVIRFNLTSGATTVIPLPSQYVRAWDGSAEVYLAFDPNNRVLFVPNNVDMGLSSLAGLGIYHVDTGVWEWEATPPAVFGSVWGFDESAGALVGIGKRVYPTAYFLYKYK
jgi:hypothetical protein